MNPSPQQAIDGVRRVLSDVIAPALADDVALAAVRDIRALLAQYDWNDVVPDMAERNVAGARLVQLCATWLETMPGTAASQLSDAAMAMTQMPAAARYAHHVERAEGIDALLLGTHALARTVLADDPHDAAARAVRDAIEIHHSHPERTPRHV